MTTTTFVDNSTLVVADWLNDVNQRVYSDEVFISDPAFGYVHGSYTISQAVFQAAINAVKGTKNTLVIPGNFTIDPGTGVTINAGVHIKGLNRDRCFIQWSSTTAFAITIATTASVRIENLYFIAPGSCTAGGAISMSGTGGSQNIFSKIKDCTFSGGYYQIYAPDASAWSISGNYMSGAVENALYTGCSSNVDDGDSSFYDNVVSNLGSTAYAIKMVSSGGLRITNNKLLSGRGGIFMDLAAGAVTSILLIQGNSIENQSLYGVRTLNSAGTAGMSQVIIANNQFGYQATPINLQDATAFMAGVQVVGNIIVAGSAATTTSAITAVAVPKSNISHNIIYGSGSTVVGITVGSLSTDCAVRDNVITGCVTNINDAGGSGTVNSDTSGGAIYLSPAKDVFTINGTTNITSITSASSVHGRVVTLRFVGALTFTDGSNLKLAGNFVTTADDTITLACNSTDWYEIARSVN